MGLHFYSCTKPCLITGKYAFNQAIKPEFLKLGMIGLHTDPTVIIEYIGFFAVALNKLHKFLPIIYYKMVHKGHVIQLVLSWRHVGDVECPLIDEILGSQGVTIFLFKFIQSFGTDVEIIRSPVAE